MNVQHIAEICHEAIRAYQRQLNEQVNFPWEQCNMELRMSAIDGVVKIINGVITSPRESHGSWMAYKINEGWVYGEAKDFAKKTHPDLVPYDELPESQKVKDEIFFGIVERCAPYVR